MLIRNGMLAIMRRHGNRKIRARQHLAFIHHKIISQANRPLSQQRLKPRIDERIQQKERRPTLIEIRRHNIDLRRQKRAFWPRDNQRVTISWHALRLRQHQGWTHIVIAFDEQLLDP